MPGLFRLRLCELGIFAKSLRRSYLTRQLVSKCSAWFVPRISLHRARAVSLRGRGGRKPGLHTGPTAEGQRRRSGRGAKLHSRNDAGLLASQATAKGPAVSSAFITNAFCPSLEPLP